MANEIWGIALLVGILGLSAGCLVPNRWLPARMPNDKLMHFVAFAVLAALAMQIAQTRIEAAWWMLGLLVAGWVIECLQQLLPDRGFSWRDIAANAAGIVFAAGCTLLCQSLPFS